MPVFRSGKGLAPDWCELEYFEIVELPVGSSHEFKRVGKKEKLIVVKGGCCIAFGGGKIDASQRTNLDLDTSDGHFSVSEVSSDSTLVRMCGHWGEETGGAGIFTVGAADGRQDKGDPVDYPKDTSFDNHYHDCDEYWIVFDGKGIAVSEGKSYEVGPGDCIATGMGHHHDFPQVFETIRGVYFETTIEGKKRRGHLWNHTHGQAEPAIDRS